MRQKAHQRVGEGVRLLDVGNMRGIEDGHAGAGNPAAHEFGIRDRRRHVVTAGELVKICKEAGVSRIVLPSYEYDLTDPEDEARFYGEALRAQQEIARMKKRIRRMQLELAENGQDHGGGKRPFGFTGTGAQKVPLARALAEQEMIQEATRRVIAGDTLRGICLDWTKRGVAGTQGRRWSTRTLRRILISPRVAGFASTTASYIRQLGHRSFLVRNGKR